VALIFNAGQFAGGETVAAWLMPEHENRKNESADTALILEEKVLKCSTGWCEDEIPWALIKSIHLVR
jgi:hypothetical protein